MAWLPISGTVPQYDDGNGALASGYVLKAYAVNTTTNIPFAVDAVASATATSIALNARGEPEVSGNVVIPHLDQNYKLALYPSQSAADADSGATWTIDNVKLPGLSSTTTTTGEINVWPVTDYGGAAFDGSNDYLTRGAGLTGAADGKKGTLVVFCTFAAASSAVEYLLANTGLALALRRNADGTIELLAENSGGTVILDISTSEAYDATDTLYCIMASWDLATPGSQQLYVNDVSDLVTSTFTNDTIDYTVGNWYIGADDSGANKFGGNLYTVYLDTTNNIDFDTESNRRKFLDDSDRPVFLGERGEVPSGSQPILFLGNDPNLNFEVNRGSGGGMTVTGSLGSASVALSGQFGFPSALDLIASASASSVASVDLEDVSYFTDKYSTYILRIWNCGVASTAGIMLRVKVSTYQTTGYAWVSHYTASNASATIPVNAANSTTLAADGLYLSSGQANGTNDRGMWTVTIENPSATGKLKPISWHGGFGQGGGATALMSNGIGWYSSGTGAVTGIRILASTGNCSLSWALYGVKS